MAKALEGRVRRSRHVDDEPDEEKVRQTLIEQHARLRELLRALDTKAVAVVRTCQPAPDMQAALEKIVDALTDHMSDEERAIVTRLPRTQDSGHELSVLREDHARQLKELDSIRRCAASSDDAISLALAVRAFVDDVLLDMDLEDRRYLSVDGRISDPT